MSKIEKIKSKIEERIALVEKCANAACEKNLHNTLEANELLIRQYKSLLDVIDSISEEKPSEDLEEAADRYASDSTGFIDMTAYRAFKAGAEWQKKKDRETIELAEEHAILAGRVQMKEEMMKDAVEGEVIYDLGGFFRIKSEAIDGAKYKVGSWVKLIIVKED